MSTYNGFVGSHFFEIFSNGDGRNNEGYLLIAGGNGDSMLYKWMGTFVFVKVSYLSKTKKNNQEVFQDYETLVK